MAEHQIFESRLRTISNLALHRTDNTVLRNCFRDASQCKESIAVDDVALTATDPRALPAQRMDSSGHACIDHRAVFALALPLMLVGGVQFILALTDVWFIGHISIAALAAGAAVQWLIAVLVFVFGSVALPLQAIVAQACGAGRYRRATHATWTALWATLCVAPLFLGVSVGGHIVLAPFGLDLSIERLANEFWFPRLCGAPLGMAAWVLCGFFNGIGQPRMTLVISVTTVLANVALNEVFIFQLALGVAGSGWATTTAQACGLLVGFLTFLNASYQRTYGTRLINRPQAKRIIDQLRLGFLVGLSYSGNMLGYALFQLMQVRLSTSDGAATQMVMMLASVTYIPGSGIASAATTLVGRSIGAGDPGWAMRLGTHVIVLAVLCMGGIGVFVALSGPFLLPLFVNANNGDTSEAMALGTKLLWIAAGCQIFDGLVYGSNSCLRGAGDAIVPAAFVLLASLLIFVPMAHSLTFAPGLGWVTFLPQFGWGARGGWLANLVYLMLLGTALFLRWYSRVWQKIRL